MPLHWRELHGCLQVNNDGSDRGVLSVIKVGVVEESTRSVSNVDSQSQNLVDFVVGSISGHL